jgi:hypothetical protein
MGLCRHRACSRDDRSPSFGVLPGVCGVGRPTASVPGTWSGTWFRIGVRVRRDLWGLWQIGIVDERQARRRGRGLPSVLDAELAEDV